MARKSRKTPRSNYVPPMPLEIIVPTIKIWLDFGVPWPDVAPLFGPFVGKEMKEFSFIHELSECDGDFDLTAGEVVSFVEKALTDPKTRVLIEVAAAHIVAANALRDRYFRCDRYKTRVDEAVSYIWEMAQEIYELNSERAVEYEGVRWPTRKARGLELWGRKWASGDIKRRLRHD